jgi:hypothetical protein
MAASLNVNAVILSSFLYQRKSVVEFTGSILSQIMISKRFTGAITDEMNHSAVKCTVNKNDVDNRNNSVLKVRFFSSPRRPYGFWGPPSSYPMGAGAISLQ